METFSLVRGYDRHLTPAGCSIPALPPAQGGSSRDPRQSLTALGTDKQRERQDESSPTGPFPSCIPVSRPPPPATGSKWDEVQLPGAREVLKVPPPRWESSERSGMQRKARQQTRAYWCGSHQEKSRATVCAGGNGHVAVL